MPVTEYEDILNKLEERLDHKRYVHTLGVAYTAASLAMRYGYDCDKAYLAGLLHDCAKQYHDKEFFEKADEFNIVPNEAEKNFPSLLHAKVGANMAVSIYGVHDEEILSAIRCHTTGKPNMSMLDKIIYIADYIEPGRKRLRNIDEIREAAFTDLNKCIRWILNNTIEYLKYNGKTIDPLSEETYQYYKNEVTDGN